MMNQPHPFEIRLQQMSNKIGALEGTISRMAQDNEALRRTAMEAKILAEVLKNTSVSPSASMSTRGDFKASKAWMKNTWAKAWGGADYVSLDDIQGRTIPFDNFVEIPIPDSTSTTLQGVLKVSMEGPMVCSHRYAAILSKAVYQVTYLNGQQATFFGRSYGRFRGISSNTDIMDSVRAFDQLSQYQPSYLGAVYDGTNFVPVGNPVGINDASAALPTGSLANLLPNFPGTGRPIVASPFSMSSGRSMQFDGLIAVEPQGAQFKRQNIPIPSAMWSEGFNKPAELSCYDVLEPSEEVIISVTPTHVNNPPFGNISDLVARNDDFTFDPATGVAANNPLPVGSWPFLAGQFDGHEGINDETLDGDTSVTVDRVVRTYDATLIIGFRGFRIIAPPGRGLGAAGPSEAPLVR